MAEGFLSISATVSFSKRYLHICTVELYMNPGTVGRVSMSVWCWANDRRSCFVRIRQAYLREMTQQSGPAFSKLTCSSQSTETQSACLVHVPTLIQVLRSSAARITAWAAN